MQTQHLDGKLDTKEVTIIGNDPHSNAKEQKTYSRVCFNCGNGFRSEDKSVCRCADCIKLYNKPTSPIPFIDAWKPRKNNSNYIGNILFYGFYGTVGVIALIAFMVIVKGCLGILGS